MCYILAFMVAFKKIQILEHLKGPNNIDFD
jgi:hypothetical protein